eukprot:634509_1
MDLAATEWRWSNKVVLITGASAGIGHALSIALSRKGMRVIGCARRMDRLTSLQEEIKKFGGEFLAIKCDLADIGSISDMFETIKREMGVVDVLINNAGMGKFCGLIDQDPSDWQQMMDVNVRALCVCTQRVVQDLLACGKDTEGHVVHVSSMSGHRLTGASGAFYAATKFAVRALGEGLRKDLRDRQSKIRVTLISPGLVETDFFEAASGSKEKADTFYNESPSLRSDDVVDAIIYALSAPMSVSVHDILIRSTDQLK